MAAKQNHLFATFIILVQIGQIKLDTRISDVVFNPPKESIMKDPTILLAIIARNAQHLLPNWLGYIENLDYPKDRMSVWVRTDHNEDNTSALLREWSRNVKPLYHRVLVNITENPKNYPDSDGPMHWTDERYGVIMELRQKALDAARKQWADYLFVVDCDVFLTNPKVLKNLIAEKKTIVAPMVEVFGGKSAYSNFWGAINEEGYYKRSENYFPILQRQTKGAFDVPMIHSTYLVDLRKKITSELTYSPPHPTYEGDDDDILVFAHSARTAGIKLYILNREFNGQVVSPDYEEKATLIDASARFTHGKLEWFVDHPEELMPISPHLSYTPPVADKMGFDEIYLINLKRRPLRRKRMLASLKELGIKVKVFDAVDGKALTNEQVKEMGIKMMPGYYDPHGKRPLTMGEIGCFLSHYLIWEEMINSGLKKVLIFEDDVRFEPNFRREFQALIDEADRLFNKYDWDMIYLGRKVFYDDLSEKLSNTSRLAWVDYSYWTLGYMLTLHGAKKLVSPKPLHRMLALDEYLPIMYNRHTKYIGRKRMKKEPYGLLPGATMLNWVPYSYWTLGYIINLKGARKLMSAKPLQKMVALDEFLPIMYNKHPDAEWSSHFHPRNLIALTAEPLLLYPTHYIGDKGYFSDTETTAYIPPDDDKKDEL